MSKKMIAYMLGSSFCGLLMMVLAALKLLGYADISWIMVFSPWWAPLFLVTAALVSSWLVAIGLSFLALAVQVLSRE